MSLKAIMVANAAVQVDIISKGGSLSSTTLYLPQVLE